MLERLTTRSPPTGLARPSREAAVVDETVSRPGSWLPYTDEAEMREAVENFRAYLSILEEWDEREKERTHHRLS